MGRSYGEWAGRLRVPMGFALGIAYLVFSQPTPPLLGLGAGIALIGVALRGWAAGCLEKNRTLARGGPYAYTRNPLYLGSLMMGAGFALAGRSWPLDIAFLALFAFVYWPVIRQEEAHLRQQFGETYAQYAAGVPALFPVRLAASSEHDGFRWARYTGNREYEAALGYLGGVAFLILKMELR
jgi:protein-S-isoprenylcysteine O-methyltransferase Ste14